MMRTLSRRRLISISASAGGALLLGGKVSATPLTRWRGVALGASASIVLRHPEAERIIDAAQKEIARLEDIFSLHRPASALSRLNAAGRLDRPPFELIELLGLCGTVHAATGGLFDPTIQPLWATYAEHLAQGRRPDQEAVRAALSSVGWAGVAVASDAITFARPGMALTLNGIAQGYIADRVVALLRGEGLTDVLVDTGELRALGGHPDGGGWPVALDDGRQLHETRLSLREMALASSSPLGTVLDAEGQVGHILDPLTGASAGPQWHLVSVTAPAAATADALSTALCLMTRDAMSAALARFPGAVLVHLA